MTGHQRAVMWIGLIIVAMNLVMKWPTIRSVIFTGDPTNANAPTSGSGSGGGFHIPIPTWPGTNIPILLWRLPRNNPAAIS